MKYFSKDNFTGDIVPHYKANRGIMTKEAAIALSKAQKKFLEKGYSIVIYDAYRPSSSVQYFVEWMNDKNNTKRKKFNYPYIEKKIDMKDIYLNILSKFNKIYIFYIINLLHYINSVSGHSRGSTIDLSIIDKNKILLKESIYEERTFNGKIYPFNNDNTIDCGTSFDLMDPASWSFNNKYDFTEEQKNNRKFIRDIMESEGFKVLDEEWWHFTLKNEPYPEQYFDFEIQ